MSRFPGHATRQRSTSRRTSHWKRSRLNLELLESRELLSGTSATMDGIQQAFGQIPMSFEANQGQTDAQVQYLARGSGYTLFLTGNEAVLSLRQPGDEGLSTAVRMTLVGANPNPRMEGLNDLPGKINYFHGNDPSRWETNIPTFGKVLSHDVYPGIDVVYYGNQRQLEYDFLVAPGADPDIIAMAFQGTDGISIDAQGNLVLDTAGGDVIHHAPVIYQESAAGRQAIAGRYVLEGTDRVGFVVGAYDPNRTLIIDPVLGYSTFLGGNSDDYGLGIAVDSTGNAYVTGFTFSSTFPTTPGAYDQTYNGPADVFVSKLDWSGTFLWYSTYLGGSSDDSAFSIAVDAFNNAYVTGAARSANFPTTTTPPAFQPTLGGLRDAFVTKFDAFGGLAYSSFLGGIDDDGGQGVAVDASGNAYLSGNTEGNFPTTIGPVYGGGARDAFAARVDTLTGNLVYARYLGGSGYEVGNDIAVNPTCSANCDAFVTGPVDSVNFPTTVGAFQLGYGGGAHDGFVTKVTPTGAMLASTYLGGDGDDQALYIAVDAASSAYVTGSTTSATSASGYFPATPGAFQPAYAGNVDAFVTKLHWLGGVLDYSTYLGGSQEDYGQSIAVDEAGFAYVSGMTNSSVDFPITATNAFQKTFGGGQIDSFVTRVNPLGTALDYSTYLGGSADEGNGGAAIAVDQAGNAYVTGYTASTNFPIKAGAFDTSYNGGSSDAFVTRISCCTLGSIKAIPGPTTFLGTGLSPTVATDGKPILLTNGATDPHYTCTGPGGSGCPTTIAVNPAPDYWIPNGPSSTWIKPILGQPVGDYVYSVNFTLPSFCSAVLMGRWSSDNLGTMIRINGNSIGPQAASFGGWLPFVITSGFKTGANKLEFVLNNSGGATGLQVDMRGFYCECGPKRIPLLEFMGGMPGPGTKVPSFQSVDSIQTRGNSTSVHDDVNPALIAFDPSQRTIRRLADAGSDVVRSSAIAREPRAVFVSSEHDLTTSPAALDLATLNE